MPSSALTINMHAPPRPPGPLRAWAGGRRARQLLLPLLLVIVLLVMNSRMPPAPAKAPVPATHAGAAAGLTAAMSGLSNSRNESALRADPAAAAATAAGSIGGISSGSSAGVGSSYALEEAARLWHPPRYSTHTCINQKFYDNWHAATCKFDNLCLNASTGQFQYYVDPDLPDIPLLYDQWGRPMEGFSKHMLNSGHAKMDLTPHVAWRPQVVRAPFPRKGRAVKWAPTPQALLQSIPTPLTTNFGHVMFDVLVPLFNMQHLFGVYTPDAQVLILQALKGTEQELRAALPALINTPNPDMSLLKLSWDYDAQWVGEYARRQLGGRSAGLVCFKSVLAGTGYLNRQMSPLDALPYRTAVVRRIGLEEAPHERPVITILNKQGRRMIENSEEIQLALQARFPLARVDMFDFGNHPNMTMPEQVALMSNTSILVTPCGGLATVLAFLRPGSTAIAMNYWHTGNERSMQLEDNYYQHIEYLDIQYFPVTPEDYENTTDRPECENVRGGSRPQDAHFDLIGSLVHCNLNLCPSGMQRLVNVVDHAVRRWAARSGRYEVLQSLMDQQAQQAAQQEEQQAAAEGAEEQQEGGKEAGGSSGSGGSGGSSSAGGREGSGESSGSGAGGRRKGGVGRPNIGKQEGGKREGGRSEAAA